jgi:hypothetical protein
MSQYFSTRQQAMSNEELMIKAPSVFATEPWVGMSDKYTFIPTIQVVEKMRSEGFAPYSAVQSRTRIPGKGRFHKAYDLQYWLLHIEVSRRDY